MSPASQGALEVERYIGSCLISSSVRPGSHKSITSKKQEPVIRGKTRACYTGQNYSLNGNEQCQVQYGHNGWTGAPLISITSSPRRCNQRSSSLISQQQSPPPQHPPTDQSSQQVPAHLHKSPLTRLAIHTQGTPLILTGKFPNRGKLLGAGNIAGTAGSPTTAACSNPGTPGNYGVSNNAGASMMNGGANNATRSPPSRPQRPADTAKKQQQVNGKGDCPAGGKEGAGTNIANIDSLSIASDESSGSNNSENSLPRIIKPRKRRKKDRKPPNNVAASMDVTKHEEQQQQQQQQQQSFGSLSLAEQQSNVGMKAYVPVCYEHHQHHQHHQQQQQHQQQQRYEGATTAHLRNHRRPPLVARESGSGYACRTAVTASLHEIGDVRQRYPYRHVEVKVLDDNRNVVVAPVRGIPGKLYRHNPHQHANNTGNLPRYVHEYAGGPTVCEESIKDGPRSCQCRYCDPAALIWDVDQNCYSPFLTASSGSTGEICPSHFSQMPPMYLSRPMPCQEQQQQQQVLERLFDVEKSRHLQERAANGVVLRRSWSDPTNYFSEEIAAPSKDVGVIGDRGQSEGKRRTLWRGDSIGIPAGIVSANTAPGSGQSASKGLEVSTEIITSPNGHRDLEIKFYSPSPCCTPGSPAEDKANSEEADEEDEDLSDIWSYHESKLQQDFRTLLQAEE